MLGAIVTLSKWVSLVVRFSYHGTDWSWCGVGLVFASLVFSLSAQEARLFKYAMLGLAWPDHGISDSVQLNPKNHGGIPDSVQLNPKNSGIPYFQCLTNQAFSRIYCEKRNVGLDFCINPVFVG